MKRRFFDARQIDRAFLSLITVLVGVLIGHAQEIGSRRYLVTNLGTLGGVLGSSAHSVNNAGLVSGAANVTGDAAEHAVVWQYGNIHDLGTLGGFNSNVDFPVKNDRGLIAGFSQIAMADPLGEEFCTFTCSASGTACNGSGQSCRGFIWRGGAMKQLGTLGGNNSAAAAANSLGLVVGIAENAISDRACVDPQKLDYKAVAWDAERATIHELPSFSGDPTGAAIAVNDSDEIVGGSGECGSGPGISPVFKHAVLWRHGSVTDLGNLGGELNNLAYGINKLGQIVGASDLFGDATGHAFLWQNGTIRDLGTLPGDYLSAAFAINDLGQVVGQSCDINFNCRAFIWENGAMTDLNALTQATSLFLITASDINDAGEIVGTAIDQDNGEPLAFSMAPCVHDITGNTNCNASSTSGVSGRTK